MLVPVAKAILIPSPNGFIPKLSPVASAIEPLLVLKLPKLELLELPNATLTATPVWDMSEPKPFPKPNEKELSFVRIGLPNGSFS